MNKKYLIILLFLVIFTSCAFATETGDYRYYTYGQDFNITNWVVDENSQLDTGFLIKLSFFIKKLD